MTQPSLRERLANEERLCMDEYVRDLITFKMKMNSVGRPDLTGFQSYQRANALRQLLFEAEQENLSDAELLLRYLAL
jgi:hypothetical protein